MKPPSFSLRALRNRGKNDRYPRITILDPAGKLLLEFLLRSQHLHLPGTKMRRLATFFLFPSSGRSRRKRRRRCTHSNRSDKARRSEPGGDNNPRKIPSSPPDPGKPKTISHPRPASSPPVIATARVLITFVLLSDAALIVLNVLSAGALIVFAASSGYWPPPQ